MIKIHPNRTIGLQRKTIADGIMEEECKVCNGTGQYNIYIPSTTIRNLKGMVGSVKVTNECTCNNGKIHTKMRVIRKNNVTAIL